MAFADINQFLDCYLHLHGRMYKVSGIQSFGTDEELRVYCYGRVFRLRPENVNLTYYTGMDDSHGNKIYTGHYVREDYNGHTNFFKAVATKTGYRLMGEDNDVLDFERRKEMGCKYTVLD